MDHEVGAIKHIRLPHNAANGAEMVFHLNYFTQNWWAGHVFESLQDGVWVQIASTGNSDTNPGISCFPIPCTAISSNGNSGALRFVKSESGWTQESFEVQTIPTMQDSD